MVVEKVRGVFSLRQTGCKKLFIDFISNKRVAARNDFDEDLPKNSNCCFYSKTMENVRCKVKIELIKGDDVG